MTATKNWGRDTRVILSLKFYYSFGRAEGACVLVNISYSGALIEVEDKSPRPEIGTLVVLSVYLPSPHGFEEVTPLELAGVVVRHSSTGFAVKFEDIHSPDVRRIIDDILASVTLTH